MYDEQQQLGDGQDNYLQGARKLAEASKKAGAAAGKAAGEAAANAAAATVKAGVEGGKAVSEIAAGTAAGGPWGAAAYPVQGAGLPLPVSALYHRYGGFPSLYCDQ